MATRSPVITSRAWSAAGRPCPDESPTATPRIRVEAGIVLPHEDVAVLHGGADGPVRCRDAQAGTDVMPRSVLGLEHVHAVAALIESRRGDAQLLVKVVHERPHDCFEGRRSVLAS